MDLKNRKIGIIGYSRTGRATAEFVAKNGGIVKVSELSETNELREELLNKGYEFELGKNSPEFLSDCDLIIISPGVSSESDFVRELENRGKDIISEIEFASRFIKGKIIGITGSNGKSTVTSMIYHILKSAGKSSTIAGNIGVPLINFVEDNSDYFVVELSSFQLEKIKDFKPFISVLLNITPDHLDRYPSFEEYALAKFNIFRNQNDSDFAILNSEDEFTNKNSEKINAEKIYFSISGSKSDIYLSQNEIFFKGEKIMRVSEIPLLGIHNVENTMASIGAAMVIGIEPAKIREAVISFKGLEHRTELCGEIKGIKFINDSKATNIDATFKALLSFSSPLILILGGKDKGGDFTKLNKLIKEKVKKLILIGAAREKIKKQLNRSIDFVEVETMRDAVYRGYEFADRGDIVILSPACASFDMYENFEERGKDFKKIVEELKREVENG